jgi:hypothetical protein
MNVKINLQIVYLVHQILSDQILLNVTVSQVTSQNLTIPRFKLNAKNVYQNVKLVL